MSRTRVSFSFLLAAGLLNGVSSLAAPPPPEGSTDEPTEKSEEQKAESQPRELQLDPRYMQNAYYNHHETEVVDHGGNRATGQTFFNLFPGQIFPHLYAGGSSLYRVEAMERVGGMEAFRVVITNDWNQTYMSPQDPKFGFERVEDQLEYRTTLIDGEEVEVIDRSRSRTQVKHTQIKYIAIDGKGNLLEWFPDAAAKDIKEDGKWEMSVAYPKDGAGFKGAWGHFKWERQGGGFLPPGSEKPIIGESFKLHHLDTEIVLNTYGGGKIFAPDADHKNAKGYEAYAVYVRGVGPVAYVVDAVPMSHEELQVREEYRALKTEYQRPMHDRIHAQEARRRGTDDYSSAMRELSDAEQSRNVLRIAAAKVRLKEIDRESMSEKDFAVKYPNEEGSREYLESLRRGGTITDRDFWNIYANDPHNPYRVESQPGGRTVRDMARSMMDLVRRRPRVADAPEVPRVSPAGRPEFSDSRTGKEYTDSQRAEDGREDDTKRTRDTRGRAR